MIEGTLDSVEKEQIRGWAVSPEDRDDRLLVEVFVRGRLRASSWANERGAAAAGSRAGEAGHGFRIGFSRPLSEDDLGQVEVYATNKSGERVRLGPDAGSRAAEDGPAAGLGPGDGEAGEDASPHWPFPLTRASAPPPGELRLEVAAAFERLGLRHFSAEGWVRSRGARFAIRGFAVRAVGPQPPTAVEVKGFFPGGETAWIGGGGFCAPEPAAPLTGFALRAADPRYEALYWGGFAAGGEIGPRRDGASCASPSAGDPLTAIRVQIRKRAPQP